MSGTTALVRTLRACQGSVSLRDVFTDWVAMSAIAFRNRVDTRGWDPREAEYGRLRSHYTPAETDRLSEALALLVAEMGDDPRDVLGETFMRLELGDKDHGQFFTPYSVAQLMAEIQVEPIVAALAERDYVTVYEPAVGAGAMMIATTQALRAHGINYQRRLHITADDISPTAVHMAYVQLSLLHVPAVVYRRNSITLETWDRWPTPAHVLGGWGARLRDSAA